MIANNFHQMQVYVIHLSKNNPELPHYLDIILIYTLAKIVFHFWEEKKINKCNIDIIILKVQFLQNLRVNSLPLS